MTPMHDHQLLTGDGTSNVCTLSAKEKFEKHNMDNVVNIMMDSGHNCVSAFAPTGAFRHFTQQLLNTH
jgi:hypothetical protein